MTRWKKPVVVWVMTPWDRRLEITRVLWIYYNLWIDWRHETILESYLPLNLLIGLKISVPIWAHHPFANKTRLSSSERILSQTIRLFYNKFTWHVTQPIIYSTSDLLAQYSSNESPQPLVSRPLNIRDLRTWFWVSHMKCTPKIFEQLHQRCTTEISGKKGIDSPGDLVT